MATQTAPSAVSHRVSRAVVSMRAEIGGVADVPVWSMAGGEAVETLAYLTRLRAQVEELHLRVLRRVDESGHAKQIGHANTANWYATAAQVTRASAHRETRLAKALETHEPTRAALAAGRMHLDQSRAVINAVTDLPQGLDPTVVAEAEALLVAEAANFDANHLRILGRHLVEVACPEVAEAHTAKLLERQEREAEAAQLLVMYPDNDGRWHGRFVLDALGGAALHKALLAIAAPKHHSSVGQRGPLGMLGEPKPSPQRMGAAFAEFVTRYPVERLPDAGGLNATLVVTMTLEALTGGLAPARLDTGDEISASLARRIACEAAIVPAVLGAKSQVLDLGRSKRFHSTGQRLAAGIQQKHCRADGCDWPPGLCHLHHPIPWSRGGTTDQANAQLLCPYHHARAHDPTYTTTTLPGGHLGFHRRT